jgi:hypothetical protein
MNARRRPRRLDKSELFRALDYRPHAGQLLVHRSTKPRRVLAAGARFGKSVCASMEAVAALLEPREKALGWTVAPTLDLSERVFLRVVLCLQEHFAHRICELDLRERKIVVCNLGGGMSTLQGKTGDNPVSLLGEGLNFLIVDEAAHLRPELWPEYLSQRLIGARGWALIISTPGGRDWFWRLYRRGQKNRDPQFESWALPTWINPHVDKELIEQERARLPAETFGQVYAAQFVDADLEWCDRCGGPDPNLRTFIFLEGDEQPIFCDECNRRVDENGHSLIKILPDGRAVEMTLFLKRNMFLSEAETAEILGRRLVNS